MSEESKKSQGGGRKLKNMLHEKQHCHEKHTFSLEHIQYSSQRHRQEWMLSEVVANALSHAKRLKVHDESDRKFMWESNIHLQQGVLNLTGTEDRAHCFSKLYQSVNNLILLA